MKILKKIFVFVWCASVCCTSNLSAMEYQLSTSRNLPYCAVQPGLTRSICALFDLAHVEIPDDVRVDKKEVLLDQVVPIVVSFVQKEYGRAREDHTYFDWEGFGQFVRLMFKDTLQVGSKEAGIEELWYSLVYLRHFLAKYLENNDLSFDKETVFDSYAIAVHFANLYHCDAQFEKKGLVGFLSDCGVQTSCEQLNKLEIFAWHTCMKDEINPLTLEGLTLDKLVSTGQDEITVEQLLRRVSSLNRFLYKDYSEIHGVDEESHKESIAIVASLKN